MRFLLLIAILVIAFILSEMLGFALLDGGSSTTQSEQTIEAASEQVQPVANTQQAAKPEEPTVVRGVMTLELRYDKIFMDGKAITLSRFRRISETAARDNILIEFVYDGTVTGSFVDEIKTILRNTETKNAGLE